MNIDAARIYSILEHAVAEVEQEIKAQTGMKGLGMVVWAGSRYNTGKQRLHIELSAGEFGQKEVKVKGVNLADMVDELVRRAGFEKRQEMLQLGAPVVEGTVVNVVAGTDSIPF